MLSLSARAILITALLVLPFFPLVPAAAAADACPEPCRTVSLYLQPGGGKLSAFAGDAMPSDPSTHSTGALRGATRPLPAPLAIPKEGAFGVRLNATAEPLGGVRGTVRVLAFDLAGGQHLLAERIFTAPDPSIPLPVDPAARSVWSAAAARYAEGVDLVRSGEAGSAVAQTAYHRTCGSPGSVQCGLTDGSPGAGAFRPCAASPPPNNIIGNALWTAANAADATVRDATGEPVCGRSIWPTVNGSAAAVDETGAGVENAPPFPAYPHEGNGSAAPQQWKTFTLNATPPAWMPQSEHAFTVPDGIRLVLDVDLDAAVGGSGSGPLPLEYGRRDALTGLDIRTPTSGAFAMFAEDAAPIEAGRHTGAFVNITDADDFTFVAPAGARIELRSHGAPNLVFTLWDVDGVSRSSTTTLSTDASSPRWFLRIVPVSTQVPPREYTFTLTFPEAGDDGVQIEEGTHAGALGDGDNVDSYTFFAWQGQRVDVSLSHGDDAEFILAGDLGSFWDITTGNDHFSGRPPYTRVWTVEVSRVYGSGPYTLTLDLNDAENHSALPAFTIVAAGEQFRYVGGMKGHGTGVDVRVDGSIYHVRPNETTLVLSNTSGYLMGRDAAGRFLEFDHEVRAATLRGPEGSMPVLFAASEGTFGPDAFYGITEGFVKRVTSDRAESAIPFDGWGEILALPNGTIIVNGFDGAHVMDFAAGTATRAPAYDRTYAFDLAGNGYFIANGTLVVRRDAQTLAHQVVARSDMDLSSLAFSEDALYAIAGPDSAILRMPFAGGFPGYEPPFEVAPPADLVPVNATDEIVGYSVFPATRSVYEEHVTRVTIENQGGSRANPSSTGFSVHALAPHVGGSGDQTVLAPAIEPGGSVIVEIPWRVKFPFVPGDKEASVTVARGHNVTQSDIYNDQLEFHVHYLAGGNYAACVEALRTLPPDALPWGPEVLCRQTTI